MTPLLEAEKTIEPSPLSVMVKSKRWPNATLSISGSHTLQATLAVTQVPPVTKDIIVGQIHCCQR